MADTSVNELYVLKWIVGTINREMRLQRLETEELCDNTRHILKMPSLNLTLIN